MGRALGLMKPETLADYDSMDGGTGDFIQLCHDSKGRLGYSHLNRRPCDRLSNFPRTCVHATAAVCRYKKMPLRCSPTSQWLKTQRFSRVPLPTTQSEDHGSRASKFTPCDSANAES